MKSRMEKYYNSTENMARRTSRNEELYKEIGKSRIDKYQVNSNAKILKEKVDNIDIDELKNILDKKYSPSFQRRSIFIEKEEEEKKEEEVVTKEYNINTILAKAREDKGEDYLTERYKKLSNTQYDILKNLDMTKKEELSSDNKNVETEESLMTLINTITAKELENTGELNPLDILTDLKGSGATEVVPAIKEESVENVDNSFYTTSSNIKEDDFDFLNDYKESKGSKVIFWIFVIIAIITFVAGMIFILNKYFELGLF